MSTANGSGGDLLRAVWSPHVVANRSSGATSLLQSLDGVIRGAFSGGTIPVDDDTRIEMGAAARIEDLLSAK